MSTDPTPMQDAITELHATVAVAETYFKEPGITQERLKIYIQSLAEDIKLVELHRGKEKADVEKAGADACRIARKIRREMEHAYADLTKSLDVSKAESEAKALQYANMGMKVQSIKITPFKGDEAKWKGFIDVFSQIIGENPHFNDVAKLSQLKMSLEGKPKELIEDMPESSTTYEKAVAALQQVYGGRKKALIRAYQKLQDLQPATNDKQSLRWTYTKVGSIIDTLRELRTGGKVVDEEYLSAVIFGKFPEDIIAKITEDDEEEGEFKLDDALKRLDKIIRVKENLARITQLTSSSKSAGSSHAKSGPAPSAGAAPHSNGPSTNSTGSASTNRGEKKEKNSSSNKRSSKRCVFDGGDHWPDECTLYVDYESRKKQLKDRCLKCLKVSHPDQPCKIERNCHYCDSKDHNRALCPKQFPVKVERNMLGMDQKAKRKRKWVPEPGGGDFLTFCFKLRSANKRKEMIVRAVVDTASSSTMITRKVADLLQLDQWKIGSRTFRLLGKQALKRKSTLASTITLEPPDSDPLDLAVYVVHEIVDDLPTADVEEFKSQHPELSQYPIPDPGKGQPIDLLLGNDCLAHLLTLDRSVRVDTDHQLMSTLYGWLLFASPKKRLADRDERTLFLKAENDIKVLFDLEAIGLKEVEHKDAEMEERALKSFYDSVRKVGERYEVAWPWAHYPPPLPENYGLAFGRLRSLHRKLKGRPDLLSEYDRIIKSQVEDGIIELVDPKTMKSGTVIHYIPHHPIISPDKTTKIRVVYDGSARASAKEHSLNDVILKGKRWLSDVVTMLLRFRKNGLAVVADIEKAFHQIVIRESDRDAVRFLWLKDPAKEPSGENLQVYRFRRMAFGIVASPFLLYATISNHLTTEEPKVAKLIGDHMYADNFMVSLLQKDEEIDVYQDVKAVFRRMGMRLTKWATNDEGLRSAIEEGDESPGVRQTILGLVWQTELDQFSLKQPKIGVDAAPPTKRNVLKRTASVFDPLGFAAPIILRAKIFLRDLWENGYTWDQLLPEEKAAEWKEISVALADATSIVLPRRMTDFDSDDPQVNVQLHVFADASEKALAAVIYLRVEKNGVVSTGFVAAKSRLAPKGTLSMPRLELLASLMGTKYAVFLKNALIIEKKVETYLWNDNKSALTWILSQKLLATVLERQVREIREFQYTDIRYVPSKLNPADPASRGSTVKELSEQDWWNGPSFLKEEKEKWPVNSLQVNEREETNSAYDESAFLLDEEEREGSPTAAPSNPEPATPLGIRIADFSSLNQLLKRTAWCVACLCRFRKKQILGAKKPRDYAVALKLWIRWAQDASCGETLPKINHLTLFRDTEGMIRCRSRMRNAAVGENAKEPLLLPPKSYLTRLIVLDLHESNLHAGSSHTLAALRRSYWIPSGRRLVYTVVTSGCASCRLKRAKPFAPPEMGPLPAMRVGNEERPFAATGMDVFGPLTVKDPGEKEGQKVWVLLFTCLRIRAIHLEPLQRMKAEDFLLAFRKFIARRGVPQDVISDNAPQFHAISGRLQQIWETFANEPLNEEYFARNRIQWRFVSQHAPWMGGAYERLVGTVKQALDRTYGNVPFPRKHFEVILAEVESVVNSRPLGYVDRELETPILTPSAFLQAKFSAIPLDFDRLDRVDKAQPAWRLYRIWQERLTQFWRTWSKFYLAELRERKDRLGEAYRTTKRVPKAGEIVIVAEENRKRALWRKAVIERLIPSEDGQVRSVQIRFADNSRTIRPIVQLVPLDLVADLPDGMGELNAQRTGIIHPQPPEPEDVQPSARSMDLQSLDEPIVVELGLDDVDVSFQPS